MTSMTDWFSNNVSDVVMDDAASWMAILDSERCNLSDRVAFAQWLDEDPSHRWAFEELSEVWAKLRILNDVEPLLDQPNVLPFPSVSMSAIPPAASRQQAAPSDWSTLAVALIVGIGSIAHFGLASPSDEFITGVGESRQIVLSDGSLLELNARTSMLVSIDDQQRRIELQNGEAVFHVAHDSRPFVVTTEFGDVVALGTSFNVEVSDGSLEVSVIEGQVSVTTNGDEAPLIDYDASASHQFSATASTLAAGDWLEVSASHQRQQFLGTEEFRKRLSWRNGVIVFEDQPLLAVVEEMRRYTETPIQVVGSHLGDLRISGEYKTSNVTQFLAQLQSNYPLVVDAQYSDWILLRAASN
jgi:transmembrane sensor